MYQIEDNKGYITEVEEVSDKKKATRKDRIKTAIIVFLVIMLILTFFSNTIMNHSLSQVSVQYVTSGEITPKVRGAGQAEVTNPYKLMIKGSRTVRLVNVKVGDTVAEGDMIYRLKKTSSTELEEAKRIWLLCRPNMRRICSPAIFPTRIYTGSVRVTGGQLTPCSPSCPG
ncbi:MAG: efflux RND transporter periplasmic adaptor subunit [Lachnospiraceae bacterium]|nr:efflux RND transporter periplasmic adaptor subunit [Lachnospiraceae bacterium]